MARRSIFSVVFNPIFYGLLLFVPAGTLEWGRAWVFLGVIFVVSALTVVKLFPGNEALINERFKPPIQRGQPLADKFLTVGFLTAYVIDVVLVPLDRFRFHWAPPLGTFASLVGLVAFLAGWTILVAAMRENRFAAPIVKHQKERGQHVIDTGVYAVVRHPMYAGGALLILGLPMFLGSRSATIAAAVPIAMIFARIFVEEPFLKRVLPGYEAYTERVRYRVLPFVW